jgi:hypothetical protein
MVNSCCGDPAEFQIVIGQIVSMISGCTAYLEDICVAASSKKEVNSTLLLVLR